MARSAWLLALLVALTWTSAPGQQYFGRNKVQYEQFSFHSFQTDHFEVFYYPPEKNAVRDAARMAERWHRRHAKSWGAPLEGQKPLILYANQADFKQTNVIPGRLSQATGGVTEALKQRVVMPLGGLYAQTNHVLGHELVHSFQYDYAQALPDSFEFELGRIPLWWVEGMAEYLSLGARDAHTAMWLRDALVQERLPTMEDLSTGDYFPYRYGHAYTAYVGRRFGDETVPQIFKRTGQVGLDSALVEATGMSKDSLSQAWIRAVRDRYGPIVADRTPADSAGHPLLTPETIDARRNLTPSLSPDGEFVAFISSEEIFRMSLYVADAETGEIIRELDEIGSTPHLDALRFLESSGTWAPDGDRLAFIGFEEGDHQISIWNVESGKIERHLQPDGITAVTNVAWSPGGETLAFTGKKGGWSDLFLLDLDDGEVERLTYDPYGELQPAWSPSGDRIAFTTERGTQATNFELLRFGPSGLGVYDLETDSIETYRPLGMVSHHNPQFGPDGESIYYISGRNGFSDLYRTQLETGRHYRLTRLKTGVSGITDHSPAFSVARNAERLAFTVYTGNEYHIYRRDGSELRGTPLRSPIAEADAAYLPPARPQTSSLVTELLAEYREGLPASVPEEGEPYDPTLALDRVRPPTVGVSAGGPFGTSVSGGIGLAFSDMLGRHHLDVAAQARGTLKDVGGQVTYMNRGGQWNYGGMAGHIPRRFTQVRYDRVAEDPETGETVPRVTRYVRRIFFDQVGGLVSYPFGPSRRLEFHAGARRISYDYQARTTYFYPDGRRREIREFEDLEPEPQYFGSGGAAYVVDYSYMGLTGPTMGARYRLEVSPQIGRQTYVTGLADYRRYWYLEPLTVAVRGLHIGHYGSRAGSPYTTEYLGFSYGPGFIRGYSLGSFDAGSCRTGTGCTALDRLTGTRVAKTSLELRIPLLGPEALSLIPFQWVPVQLAPFLDAGLAWTADQRPVLDAESPTSGAGPILSAGLSSRINVLGRLILEPYLAVPFQRSGDPLQFGLRLSPGW